MAFIERNFYLNLLLFAMNITEEILEKVFQIILHLSNFVLEKSPAIIPINEDSHIKWHNLQKKEEKTL